MAQEEGEKQSQPFIVGSGGEVWGRPSAEGGRSSEMQREPQPLPSLPAGKCRQQALKGSAKLFSLTSSTFMFSSWRSDESLNKCRS